MVDSEVLVGAHVCLDIRHYDPGVAWDMISSIQPGIRRNPNSNLTHITNPISPDLEERMAEFIQEASQREGGVTTGGTVSNTGIPLGYLLGGENVELITKVGSDPVGESIKQIISSHHQGPLKLLESNSPSSYTIITQSDGQAHYFHCAGTNDDFAPSDLGKYLTPSSKSDGGFFVFGYPPLMKQWNEDEKVLGDTLKKIRDNGKRTYLDMNGVTGDSRKWQGILNHAMPHVDVFNPNLEEALTIMDPYLLEKLKEKETSVKKVNRDYDIIDAMTDPKFTLKRLGKYYLEMGGHAVIIKCGKQGLYLKTNNDNPEAWRNVEAFVPAYVPRTLVDTTGAGDNVLAALVAGDFRGYGPTECLELGVGAGLRTVEYRGSIGAFHSMDHLSINGRQRIGIPNSLKSPCLSERSMQVPFQEYKN